MSASSRFPKATPLLALTDPERYIEERIQRDPSTRCWLWIGSKSRGYGSLTIRGKHWKAHRLSYQLDHLCRVPACVNPEHLEPVTHVENQRRARRTHCKHGHELTPENSYEHPRGGRSCRACWTITNHAARRSSS